MTPPLRPLSERVLSRPPGSRAYWVTAWATVPWLNAGANLLLGDERTSAVWEQGTLLVILNYAALSFAILITLWGTERIARHLDALRATTSKILHGGVSEPFRGMHNERDCDDDRPANPRPFRAVGVGEEGL